MLRIIKYNKSFKIIFVLLLSIFIVFWVIVKLLQFPEKGFTYSIDNIGTEEVSLIESTFMIKIPEESSIENASIWGGKDYTAYIKIVADASKINEFKSNIKFNYSKGMIKQGDLSHPKISWWRIERKGVLN